jgi:hypothetical protein
MKKNYFHIVGFALLISFLALMIALVPAFSSIKNQVVGTFNQVRFAGNVKNFGSSDVESSDTTTIKSLTACPYNIKITKTSLTQVLNPESTNGSSVLSLNKVGEIDNYIPALQVMCLSVDQNIVSFRDSVLAKWQADATVGQNFGMNLEAATKLSVRDFYKLYTEKISTACSKSTNYKDITFLNNDLYSTFLAEFNTCHYEYPTLNQIIDEYYFFPIDVKQPILFVRSNNLAKFNKDFLITKR